MFKWTTWLRQVNIGLSYHLKINPYNLTIDEWARRVRELDWIREQEAKKQNG